ncbi:MAG: hypothetical protein A2X32_07660 [Elusimicrobia bacterium GWC2_64_44]|nr:MAG: hypothetical protein A2X32_07660 [Elusimicrobia bacterium GWC2_64_44]
METKELNIRISITRRGALGLLSLFFLTWHPGFIGSESLQLTTYYPAPYGGYVSLLASGGTNAAPANTLLVRDAGRLGIGTAANAPTSKVDIRIPVGLGVDGVQITDDNQNPDTRSYATFGVTRAAGGSNLAYIGLTKAGTYPWALGVASTNDLIMGASNAGNRTINAPMFRLSTGGNVAIGGAVEGNKRLRVEGDMRVTGDLYVDGMIQNLCSRQLYSDAGTTGCPLAGQRVIGFLGDGNPRISGFLPANSTTSGVGRYVVLGEDWGGTMICCKL